MPSQTRGQNTTATAYARECRVSSNWLRPDHPAVMYCTVNARQHDCNHQFLHGTFLHWCSVTPLYSEAPTMIVLQVNLDWPADFGHRVDWVYTSSVPVPQIAAPVTGLTHSLVCNCKGLFASRRFRTGDIVSIVMQGFVSDVSLPLRFGAHYIEASDHPNVTYTKDGLLLAMHEIRKGSELFVADRTPLLTVCVV